MSKVRNISSVTFLFINNDCMVKKSAFKKVKCGLLNEYTCRMPIQRFRKFNKQLSNIL